MANSAFTPAVLTVSGSSSTSSGEKNYVTATDGNASGLWVASGVTIATSTSTIPDNITKASSLAITWTSGTTGYARYRFTLDQADYGKKFKIQWDQVYGTAGHWTLQVYSNTASDYTGTSTQLTVQTSAVPGITGTFTTSVDMPGSTAPYIEIRIVASSASATTIYLNSILMGPGTIVQGAAISEWQSYSNTITGGGTATFTYAVRQYRRVGSNLEIYFHFGVSANGSTGSVVQIPLPTNLNIDLSKVANETVVGEYTLFTGTVYNYTSGIRVYNTAPNALLLLKNASSASYVGSDLVNGQVFYAKASVPIAEWSGSGTVSLGAGAQVEYAYNNTAWGTGNTTAFAYGPGGASITGALTGVLTQRVRFQYPIQQDDQLVVELSSDGIIWRSAQGFMDASGNPVINSYSSSATGASSAGVYLQSVTGSVTDLDVVFMRYASLANDDVPTVDWINGWKWRVRKAKASSPVGFGLAGTDGGAGLVTAPTITYSNLGTTLSFVNDDGTTIGSAPSTYTIKFARTGNLVTCSMYFTNMTPSAGKSPAFQTIASQYIPTTEAWAATPAITINSVCGMATLRISTSGRIAIFTSAAAATGAVAVSSSGVYCNFTYSVL